MPEVPSRLNLDSLRSISRTMTTAMLGVFALASIGLGCFVFWKIDSDENAAQAHLAAVAAHEVQPETLTVVDKYTNHDRHGHTRPHIIYRSTTDPRIDVLASQAVYDAATQGTTESAYHFPDGYFFPQYYTPGDSQLAKWIFLGFGLTAGAVLLAAVIWRRSKPVATIQ